MELSLGKRRHEGAVALEKARQADLARALEAQGGLDGNEALQLGCALAGMLDAGVDKLMITLSPGLAQLGPELRRLCARAGLVALVGQPVGDAKAYGEDRVFVGARLESDALAIDDATQKQPKSDDQKLRRLISAGLPVLRWTATSLEDERARWTLATRAVMALSGSDLATAGVPAAESELAPETPALTAGPLTLFTTPLLAMMLPRIAGTLGPAASASAAHWISALFAMADPGDFVVLSLHAAEPDGELEDLAQGVRDVTKLAVIPAKGFAVLDDLRPLLLRGKNRGLFVQLVSESAPQDERARAIELFHELARAERRVVRLHSPDVLKLGDALREAAGALAK